MKFKDKLLFTIFTIFTLGIYPIVIFNKKPQKQNNELSRKDNDVINPAELLSLVGGKDNINGIEYTQTKIKIMIEDKDLVRVDELQKMKGVSGVFATSSTISLMVGNIAKSLSIQMMKKMEN